MFAAPLIPRPQCGELIAFIDSDCIAANDWLDKIAIAHKSSYNVIGGTVNAGNSSDDLVGYAGYMAEFREFLPAIPQHEVTHVPTCNSRSEKNPFALLAKVMVE